MLTKLLFPYAYDLCIGVPYLNVYFQWVNTCLALCLDIILNVKTLAGAFNQEKALVGAFSVIVQPVVEPMDRFTALIIIVDLDKGM